MSAGPLLDNSGEVSTAQLDALLIGRTALLEELLESLREQARGGPRRHWLLRGQRGLGKTHLLSALHHRVRTDSALSTVYLPLWLTEEDLSEVYSSATLLLALGEHLAEETKDGALRQRLGALEGAGGEEAHFQALAELLSGETERRGRVLLVRVEGLGALPERFAPKERKDQSRQLRALLRNSPHFLFLTTALTRHPSALEDPKEPLSACFQERDLSPLTEPETEELLRRLAVGSPRPVVGSRLEGEPGRLRLRIIHRVTGGLPRSLRAYAAVRAGVGRGALVQELRALLNRQEGRFESLLARLPPRERKVVTTLALAPTNLTVQELAQLSRLPERTLPVLLERLEQEGHVRAMGSSYELSEGLLRLWYQHREGRLVLEPLVQFLAYGYRLEALERSAAPGSSVAERLAQLQAEELWHRASLHARPGPHEQLQQEAAQRTAELQASLRDKLARVTLQDRERAAVALQECLSELDKAQQPRLHPLALYCVQLLRSLHDERHELSHMLEVNAQLIARFGALQEEPFRQAVAEARAQHLAVLLANKSPSFEEQLKQWLEDYGHLPEPGYQGMGGALLLLAAMHSLGAEPASAQGLVNRWVESAASGRVTDFDAFWGMAAALFVFLGPEPMRAWLSRLAEAPLAEETHTLVQWHLMVAQALLEAEPGSAWARVPPELRSHVEALVRQLRELRARQPSQLLLTGEPEPSSPPRAAGATPKPRKRAGGARSKGR